MERSQFLFLQLWSADDWKVAARPVISLGLSALVLDGPRVRKLCMAGLVVAACGLAIALIASVVGPVAFLLQGQAWRWIWVAGFASVLLLAPTAIRAWSDNSLGPLSAVLLLAAWTVPALDGALCAALAFLFWLVRSCVTPWIARYVRWIATTGVTIIVACVIAKSWKMIVAAPQLNLDSEPLLMSLIRNILSIDAVAVLIVWSITYRIGTLVSSAFLAVYVVAIVALAACVEHESFSDPRHNKKAAEPAEFTDWREAIPQNSNVFVVPYPTSPGFAWFTLERPSYLSLDQSAGAVFSRKTALEVRRRAAVVLPVWDQNWQIRSRRDMTRGASASATKARPLTREALIAVCSDLELDFVVSKESAGFNPLRHMQKDEWKDWNLYDCRQVRATSSST